MVIAWLQTKEDVSLLGNVPQQIRLFLSQNTYMSSNGIAYDKCTACSSAIMKSIEKEGISFIVHCLEHPKTLEVLTGLDSIGDVDVEWDED